MPRFRSRLAGVAVTLAALPLAVAPPAVAATDPDYTITVDPAASGPAIADTMRKVEGNLAGNGRLLVRYSGTEPLLRIMLEGKDDGEITQWANQIASVVKEHLA